ncbi:MAG: surface carbohydrate biosynthesis protein [Wenzhouxiangella sp.]
MRCLILPCETRVREFRAKLLLALVAASRGVSAIVGAKKAIDLNLDRYPAGVYIGKSVTARSRHNLQLARACGHRVALWDEEGLVWASREVYWRTKVDAATLNTPELLLAWGQMNASAWTEHPDYAGVPVVAAGNPRADLLKPALRALFDREVAAIRERFGEFVLINTNFSRVNHVQPRQNRHLKWLREQRPDDPRGGFAAHKYDLFKAFCQALPALARAMPDRRFVIRPHPSEKAETWQALAAGLDNVSVQHDGNVVAWLLACQGLVHNGCTTAIEAFQVSRPALAFTPLPPSDFDHPLPNGVSLDCPTVEQLQSRVEQAFQHSEELFAEQQAGQAGALMREALAGIDRPGLDCDALLDALAPLLAAAVEAPSRRSRLALMLRRAARPIEHRLPGTANYGPYLAHMFAPLDDAEVGQELQRMAACLELAELPRWQRIGDNVFKLDAMAASR